MSVGERQSSGSVPVAECVRQSYRVLAENWSLFLPAALVVALAAILSALLGATSGLQLIFNLVGLLVDAAFSAVVFRKVMNDQFLRPTGLRLGADEFRLFAVGLMVSAVVAVAGLLPAVFLVTRMIGRAGLSESEMEQLVGDPEALWDLMADNTAITDVALAVLVALPVLWLSGRLFISAAATFGEKRIAFVEAWQWSSGNGWRIAASLLLVAIPLLLANLFVLTGPVQMGAQNPVVMFAVLIIAGTGTALLRIPVLALGAILYTGLRPPA